MADRITTLPSGVIEHILTCLPLKDAVRTSILSKEWRYKWINMPHVVFDRTLQQQLSENHDLESVVNHTLLKHQGGMTKFTVKLSDDKIYPVSVWLHLLLFDPVEILELEFSESCPFRLLPNDLFLFKHLKHLYIKLGKIKLPSSYEGFRRITSLKLMKVKIDLGDLVKLLSKCPKLESVELELPQLDGWRNEPPSEINHVTFLRLHSIDFRWLDSANWVLKLLRSFPDLERLEIKRKLGYRAAYHSSVGYLDAKLLEAMSNTDLRRCRNLKFVSFENLFEYPENIKFMNILYIWSPKLKFVKPTPL